MYWNKFTSQKEKQNFICPVAEYGILTRPVSTQPTSSGQLFTLQHSYDSRHRLQYVSPLVYFTRHLARRLFSEFIRAPSSISVH
jgi:hypothetical protein